MDEVSVGSGEDMVVDEGDAVEEREGEVAVGEEGGSRVSTSSIVAQSRLRRRDTSRAPSDAKLNDFRASRAPQVSN